MKNDMHKELKEACHARIDNALEEIVRLAERIKDLSAEKGFKPYEILENNFNSMVREVAHMKDSAKLLRDAENYVAEHEKDKS